MERVAVQGRMLRDAKRRLRDPASSRRVRWAAFGLIALTVGPILGAFLVFAVLQVTTLFR